jgi:hypothetical protein
MTYDGASLRRLSLCSRAGIELAPSRYDTHMEIKSVTRRVKLKKVPRPGLSREEMP